MRLGYRSTAKRDYRNALVNFRKALQARPGDRYATVAINNISGYAARRESKLVFIPGIQGAPVNRIGAGTRTQDLRLFRSRPLPQVTPKPQESPPASNSQSDPVTPIQQDEAVASSSQICLRDKICSPIALVPNNDRALLTTAPYPKLLFYIPQTSGKQIELLLRSTEDNAKIYQLSIPAPERSGIVSFDLSTLKDAEGQSLPPLETGKKYQWSLAIGLNSSDRSKDLVVDAAIERQQVNPELVKLLQQGSASDRISLYAVNNFWYDALATLYEERQSHPDDSSLVNDWTSLLTSVDLGSLAKEPLVDCCLSLK
jgi:hypothetical protein